MKINASNNESAKHLLAVEALSHEIGAPVDQVQEIYFIEHAKLERVARIKTFLPIFTSRRVRDILKMGTSEGSLDKRSAENDQDQQSALLGAH